MAYQDRKDKGYSPKAAWRKLQERPDPLMRSHGFYNPGELEFTLHYGKEVLGMTETLADVIAFANDEEVLAEATPERRYEVVLEWTRNHMADTPSS